MVMKPCPDLVRVAIATAFIGYFIVVPVAGQAPLPAEGGPRPAVISHPLPVQGPGTPGGPPPNLESGVFQPTVETMWRQSPTFRRQCQRLAAERTLVVTLVANVSQRPAFARASTEVSRRDGAVTSARVVILSPNDTVELIAHEIEHVVEQLDGVAHGDQSSTSSTHAAGAAYETARAVEIGRLVAREVQANRGRIVMRIPQRDQPGSPLDPASASVSADGRFIAFTSAARLEATDDDDDVDLYVFDVQSGRTTLESPSSGWASRYRSIVFPRISGDGRFVVVQAIAEAGAPTFAWQVVLLDRRERTGRVVSVDSNGSLANGHCTQAAISADGTAVVFESVATNLVESGDANGNIADIYMVRLVGNGVARVSVATDGSQPIAGQSVTPSVSGDGRYVAFMSTADLECSGASMCRASSGRRKPVAKIYLRDTVARTTSRVSRSSSGRDPNGPSSWPSIAGDGRSVAFVSEASNLVRRDGNRQADIFIHDTSTGATELVSRRHDGRPGSSASRLPAVSADGKTVAFQSLASDLVCARNCASAGRDINLLWDVFVYERSSGLVTRASADETGEWMEPSRAPSLNGDGRVLVFASRHPIDPEDMRHDDDLFVWMRGPGDDLEN